MQEHRKQFESGDPSAEIGSAGVYFLVVAAGLTRWKYAPDNFFLLTHAASA